MAIKTKNNNVLKVFETFSGIGAQHKALQIIKKKFGYDYKIVATSEWDIYSNIAYNAIYHTNGKTYKRISLETKKKFLEKFVHSSDGKTPMTCQQFNKLSEQRINELYSSYRNCNNLGSILDISGELLINSIKQKKVDLITYSFPCQDLSVAGSFYGFNKGMGKDSGTRSSLLWQIGRILSELKKLDKLPKFLLLENVKNMISKTHNEHYKKWLDHLNKLGYSTKTFVLNAKDYGIPQNRERVYALSILEDNKNSMNIQKLGNPLPLTKKKLLKDIICDEYSNKTFLQEAIEAQPRRTKSRLKMYSCNRKLNDYKNTRYTRTITTRQDRHPNAGVIDLKNTIIGDKNRIGDIANYRFITPREAYFFMGFSHNDFEAVKKLNLGNTRLYKQAGNSIVVDVIAAIMKLIQEINNS